MTSLVSPLVRNVHIFLKNLFRSATISFRSIKNVRPLQHFLYLKFNECKILLTDVFDPSKLIFFRMASQIFWEVEYSPIIKILFCYFSVYLHVIETNIFK